HATVDVTQLFSLRENAIAKEPGSSYFKPRRCVSRLGLANGGLDSLESSPYVTLSRGAFSASSLVTPTPVAPSRDCVVPVCNSDFIPADSPAHCLAACPPIPSPLLFCGVLPCRHLRPAADQPPRPLPTPSKLRPTAKPTTDARPGPRPRAKPFISGRSPSSKLCPCNTRTPPASTSVHAPT